MSFSTVEALRKLLTTLQDFEGDIRDIVRDYMLGHLNDPLLIRAFNYLTHNSKVVGHDLFKLNMNKELNYLMNHRKVSIFPLYDKKYNSNNSTFISDIIDKDVKDPHDCPYELRNERATFKRNKYFMESMTAIGGGNLGKLNTAMDYIRIGGTLQDKVNYLSNYSCNNETEKYAKRGELFLSYEKLSRHVFGSLEKKPRMLNYEESVATIKINKDANPGYLLNEVFSYKKKGDCMFVVLGAYEIISTEWRKSNSTLRIETLWTMASRPKLTTYEKALNRVRHGVGVGRVISLPDAIEQWISHPIWYPLMSAIKYQNKECLFGYTPIMLGMRRAGIQWREFSHHIKRRWNYIYSGDWSQYDMRVPTYLWYNALNAIKYYYEELSDEEMSDEDKNYMNHWFTYVKEQVIHGSYIIKNKVRVERVGGVPSGSLLTSLIDSITNYNAIYETMRSLGYNDGDFEVFVYGDDHIVCFNDLCGRKPREFREDFLSHANALFNFKGSVDDTTLNKTEFMYCRYKRPVYDEPWYVLAQGTSHLKPVKYEYSDTPFQSYDFLSGTTHRSMIEFKGKPSFLSYYWRHDGLAIRPSHECFSRILNPESPVNDLKDYEALLWSWLFENEHNKYFLNDMYYLLMDLEYMKDDILVWGEGEVSLLRECKYRKWYYGSPNVIVGKTRMWFRRRTDIKTKIDIEKEDPWIQQFSDRFRKRYEKLTKIYYRAYNKNENYNIRKQFYEAIKNDKSWDTNKQIIGEKSINPFEKFFKEDEQYKCIDIGSLDNDVEVSFRPDNAKNKIRNMEKILGIAYFEILSKATNTLRIKNILSFGKDVIRKYNLMQLYGDLIKEKLSYIKFKEYVQKNLSYNLYLRMDDQYQVKIIKLARTIPLSLGLGRSKYNRFLSRFEFLKQSKLFESFSNNFLIKTHHYLYKE